MTRYSQGWADFRPELKEMLTMKYRVAIRRNSDGRIHVSRWHDYEYDLAGLEFLWSEGNMACDCNLHEEFERVSNPEREEDDFGCGDSAYDVVRFEIDGVSYTPEQLSERIRNES